MSSRINFGKVKDSIPLPNLIECQLESFNRFLKEGIDEVLTGTFPISDSNGVYELHYVSSEMSNPKMTPEEAKIKNLTYSAPLKAVFRLVNKEIHDIQESEVFLGDFPYMTELGTFIFNGIERVIVNQIVRSPGIYFDGKIDTKGRSTYTAKIIPSRGAWVSFEMDSKGLLWARVDNSKKIYATLFLKAIGIGDSAKLLELFDNDPYILNTLEKDATRTEEEALIEFYRRLRPNDPPNLERAKTYVETTFFNIKKYDLAPVGRYKMNKKLALRQRALKKSLANNTNGFDAGTVINDKVLSEINTTEIFVEVKDSRPVKVIGNGMPEERYLTKEDFIAAINYLVNLDRNIGDIDNIDHLGNRRIRMVGELLQNQFQIGINRIEKFTREKMNTSQATSDEEKIITPHTLIHIKPLVAVMKEFLGSSQLSQFVDQVNPLAELTNKRRTSALGPGGIQKDRAGIEVRDVHYSHYGKICPIETPEGFGVGLINSMASFSRVNDHGFLETPYRPVNNGKVGVGKNVKVDYLTADDEEKYYIAEASEVNNDGTFKREMLTVRYAGDYHIVKASEVDYVDVAPKQPFGIAANLIPFLDHDDANRAVMGSNMQRQGVPLIKPDEPMVGTGVEGVVATNTRAAYVAEGTGVVTEVKPTHVKVKYKAGGEKVYQLNKFVRTNANTCFNHYVKVTVGQELKEGDVIADSTSAKNGELAIGKNLTVAFMPFNGYNFEDAIVLNEKLVKEDAFTRIMITEHLIEVRDTKLGPEMVTRDIPNVGEGNLTHLDETGVVVVGSKVGSNDILVGKVTPKSQDEISARERLLKAIFAQKAKDFRDSSLRIPNGKSGTVIDVVRLTKEDTDLPNGVIEQIKVYVAQRRKIVPGDKMAGRHGNKGVVSIILPEEDMPFLEDGTPVDVCLNPLGVPSRMNIGQIMETHLGMVAKALGVHFDVPVFDGATPEEISDKLKEAGLPENGKFKLYDGRTGEPFENPVTVGVMYMLLLNHQVSDKLHARSTGPYSLVTQQPLGGKAQMGGQRFGEMEVWALEAHGAAHTLQEILTLKSDDVKGRAKLYEAIIKGLDFPEASVPESFRVLVNEIRGLGLNIDAITGDGRTLFEIRKPKVNVVIEDETEEEDDDFEEKDEEDLDFNQ